jgi:hypothetical protein
LRPGENCTIIEQDCHGKLSWHIPGGTYESKEMERTAS